MQICGYTRTCGVLTERWSNHGMLDIRDITMELVCTPFVPSSDLVVLKTVRLTWMTWKILIRMSNIALLPHHAEILLEVRHSCFDRRCVITRRGQGNETVEHVSGDARVRNEILDVDAHLAH